MHFDVSCTKTGQVGQSRVSEDDPDPEDPIPDVPEFEDPVPVPDIELPESPVPVAPIVEPPSSQFHAQDEFGQFSFGYQNIHGAKTETKDAFGVTRGSYQYVDANGVLQTVHYIADDVNGFRVAGTNIPVAPEAAPAALPVAPVAPAAAPLVAPVAPEETPEVAAARAEHLAAHAEATAAAASVEKREAEPIEGDFHINGGVDRLFVIRMMARSDLLRFL